MAFISVKDMYKTYGSEKNAAHALNGVSLSISMGEFVVLIGKSGSGKTTLLNVISGLSVPSSGEVLINNTSIWKLSDKERTVFRRKNIGMVYQDYSLIPDFTVKENIELPSYIDNRKMDVYLYDSVLELLELKDKDDKFPNELSGGEQQRVAFARAIVNKTKLLLADEPTGNLDSVSAQEIMNILKRCWMEFGMTILMVTHDLDLAKQAPRILTIKDGIIEQDLKGFELL